MSSNNEMAKALQEAMLTDKRPDVATSEAIVRDDTGSFKDMKVTLQVGSMSFTNEDTNFLKDMKDYLTTQEYNKDMCEIRAEMALDEANAIADEEEMAEYRKANKKLHAKESWEEYAQKQPKRVLANRQKAMVKAKSIAEGAGDAVVWSKGIFEAIFHRFLGVNVALPQEVHEVENAEKFAKAGYKMQFQKMLKSMRLIDEKNLFKSLLVRLPRGFVSQIKKSAHQESKSHSVSYQFLLDRRKGFRKDHKELRKSTKGLTFLSVLGEYVNKTGSNAVSKQAVNQAVAKQSKVQMSRTPKSKTIASSKERIYETRVKQAVNRLDNQRFI